jgi:hypothetical protein
MKFPYSVALSLDPDTGDGMFLLRPQVEVRIWGPSGFRNYLAQVDTGADNTIFPRAAAIALGIPLQAPRGSLTKSFGGHTLAFELGDAEIEIADSNETIRWQQRVQFFDFSADDEEVAVLGHVGFLEYSTAIFDGELATLKLDPNSTLPSAR